MEAFSVFATLSLVDMISGPLGRVRSALQSVSGDAASLGQRMGNLASAMAPVALAAGAVLGVFGKCVSTAAGFEDQMAKVGAVSRATASEMRELEAKARELGATTQFTAVQVGQAEQYLAMAGFTAQENIAALPGVLNLAAATATDLGRAADISSDILSAFGLKAGEMTRVADTLALTCSTANVNMELLGETMKYVAPVSRMAGLSLEETAAMAGLLGNVGIKGSQAGTTMRAMLNKLAAPTKEAQKLLQQFGVTVKDQAGNLRSPVQVLGELSQGLSKMGTAEQIAAMKTIVGEEAISGFSELIKQQGIGAIAEYAKKLEEGGGSAEEMARRMNDTLAGSLRGLGSAWESVQITIGKLFLPAVRAVVDAITGFLRLLDQAAQNPFGAFLLKIVGAISTAIVALTALSAAIWFFSNIGPMLSKAIAPALSALAGLGAPILLIMAALAGLYVAWRINFGGMADFLSDVWKKITLTVRGVISVFKTLKDGHGEIRGELATQIKAAGLVGLVTTVSRIVRRIQAVFQGFRAALGKSFDRIDRIMLPAKLAAAELLQSISGLFSAFDGGEITSAVSSWNAFGAALGKIAGGVLEGLAQSFAWVVQAVRVFATVIGYAINGISALCGWILDLIPIQRQAGQSADPTSWSDLGKVVGILIGAFMTWKAVLIAWHGVVIAVNVATKAWAAAQLLLNAAMKANPVGLLITAVTGLIALAGYVITNWDEVKTFFRTLWDKIASWAREKLDAIKSTVSGALSGIGALAASFGASILSAIQNAWDGISSGASAAWSAITGVVSGAWNGIVSLATSFGASILSAVQGAWDGISSGASAAWSAITGVVSSAWENIISGLTGFGASLLAGIQDAWNSAFSFLDSINLFESGAKLLSTFIDGIKSKVDALLGTVSNAFASVREYLPFSDAHVGPLSQLTLSGTRMMTTLAEGVGAGQGTLTDRVAQALTGAEQAVEAADLSGRFSFNMTEQTPNLGVFDTLQGKIEGAWSSVQGYFDGLNLFEKGQNLLSTFTDGVTSGASTLLDSVSNLDIVQTLTDGLAKGRDALSGFVSGALDAAGGALQSLGLPVNIGAQAETEAPVSQPSLPGAGLVDMLTEGLSSGRDALSGLFSSLFDTAGNALKTLTAPANVVATEQQTPEIPQVETPQIPEVAMPELPQIPTPRLPDEAEPERTNTRQEAGGRTYHITISNMNLPNVTDAPSFAQQLSGALSGIEGNMA